MDWRGDAACRDEDPELFFPIGTTGPAILQTEQAKAICRTCPVREACLEHALEAGVQGIWGATDDDDRRNIKRRRARARKAELEADQRRNGGPRLAAAAVGAADEQDEDENAA